MESKTSLPPGLTRGLSSSSVSLTVDIHGQDETLSETIEEHLTILDASRSQAAGDRHEGYSQGELFFSTESGIETGQSRLDLQHAIAKRILHGRLGLAPVENPRRVLDLGTGTGIWAIEFAEQYPNSQVLGTDLSPISPDRIPSNCLFMIANIQEDWDYGQTFDYVHGRYLCAYLNDFPSLFKSIHDSLRPGGWVEFQETILHFQAIDGTLEGTALQRWNTMLLQGIREMGRDALSAARYKDWMADAGFVNIQEQMFAVPMNPWARGNDEKALGRMQMRNMLDGLDGITQSIFSRAFGWSQQEIDTLLVDVRRDIQDRNIHAYMPISTTYAQRQNTESN